jgi:hypothetical protein
MGSLLFPRTNHDRLDRHGAEKSAGKKVPAEGTIAAAATGSRTLAAAGCQTVFGSIILGLAQLGRLVW